MADQYPLRKKTHHVAERPPFERIALLLQGGGALGSYQAGVYQALAEADLHPDWVAGISIGAINSALIAGNPPERRVEACASFWEAITSRRSAFPICLRRMLGVMGLGGDHAHGLLNQATRLRHPDGRRARLLHAASGAAFPVAGRKHRGRKLLRCRAAEGDAGATGRFRPHQRGRHAFQRRRRQRAHRKLRVFRHRRPMISAPNTSWPAARCRLAFRRREIDGEYYWDGGLVSNTPLQWVLDS